MLAKEKDLLEREKWDLRRQTKEATEHTGMLRSHLDLKENRIKELEAELAMVRQIYSPRGGTPADVSLRWILFLLFLVTFYHSLELFRIV